MKRGLGLTLGILCVLLAFGLQAASAAGGVRFKSEGRASLEGWKVDADWERYEARQINIGSSPAEEIPAFVFDLPEDGIEIDFRNEDFKTPEGFGQGNIADPRPVEDLEAALDRAKRDVHFFYHIWVEGREEPAGIILTPYQINATRAGDTVIVKLTNEALTLRDVRIKY